MSEFLRRLVKPKTDQDFLPAAVEILERPPSPLGRATLWALLLFLLLALIWSWFGTIDVVAVAEGQLVPRERVKVVQAAELGVVRSIHVQNGQKVTAGELLIELDPTAAEAEKEQAATQLQLAETEAARSRAIVSYLQSGRMEFVPPATLTGQEADLQQSLITSTVQEYEAHQAALRQSGNEKQQQLRSQALSVEKIEALIPLQQQQVDARQTLVDRGVGSRLVYLDALSRLTELQKQLEVERQNGAQIAASIELMNRQIDENRAQFEKTMMDALATATAKVSSLQQEVAKAAQRVGLQTLTAPISGIIQQLSIHTTGGVVQPAQALLVIVPEDVELIAEANLDNKDAAWVRAGDPVAVKLQAYPFTDYGTVSGVLETISSDAVSDDKHGLFYQTTARLNRQTLAVDGQEVRLAPGMALTLEIKIGQRRILDYFLSPIMKTTSESIRER